MAANIDELILLIRQQVDQHLNVLERIGRWASSTDEYMERLIAEVMLLRNEVVALKETLVMPEITVPVPEVTLPPELTVQIIEKKVDLRTFKAEVTTDGSIILESDDRRVLFYLRIAGPTPIYIGFTKEEVSNEYFLWNTGGVIGPISGYKGEVWGKAIRSNSFVGVLEAYRL